MTEITVAKIRRALRAKNPFFGAEDFEEGPETFVVKSLSIEVAELLSGREEATVMRFEDTDRALVVGRINLETMIELFGDDVDDWAGKTIKIGRVKLDRPAFGRTHAARILVG